MDSERPIIMPFSHVPKEDKGLKQPAGHSSRARRVRVRTILGQSLCNPRPPDGFKGLLGGTGNWLGQAIHTYVHMACTGT